MCWFFCKCHVQWIASGYKEYILQCLILYILLCKWQCPRPNPSHCEGFCNVPFLNAMARILVVEFGLTGLTSTSQKSRTTASSPLHPGASPDLYASKYTQWFIDFLFITRDSRKSNKLCGRKTTKQKRLALRVFF